MSKIAAVVLAAGNASRFGDEKVFLKLPNDKRVIRHIVDVISSAGFSPVFVVIRQAEQAFQDHLVDTPARLLENPHAHLGMSTSLQTGVSHVPAEYNACMIALGDQPFITPELLRLLTDEYNKTHAQIVYPLVGGVRSNPVILDRSAFPAVMRLQGDTGARALPKTFKIHTVEWPDARLSMDIDTPEDYQTILEQWDKPDGEQAASKGSISQPG
jgi:molybdenum cofactor cytidylyltransferase